MKTDVPMVELRVHDLPYGGHLSDGSSRLPIIVS